MGMIQYLMRRKLTYRLTEVKMTASLHPTTTHFPQLLQELLALTQLLQNTLSPLTKVTTTAVNATTVHAIVDLTQQLAFAATSLLGVQRMSLLKHEYVNICDLVICTHSMATHLLGRRQSPLWICQYARRGKQLA